MTDIFYQDINPVQEPFGLPANEDGRQQVVFNIETVKTKSDTFLEEIVQILVLAGVGVFNTNIFASAGAAIPAGDGPFLSVIETGGAGPIRIQNSIAPIYVRPGAKIVTRAKKYRVAGTMARAAYDALAIVRNQMVTIP